MDLKHAPSLVRKLAMNYEAWIVGSAANHTTKELPRDWDVVIPITHWEQAASLIPSSAKPNTFGGWKCISDGMEVDVWPGDLGRLLTNSLTSFAWHPRSGVRISKYSEHASNPS